MSGLPVYKVRCTWDNEVKGALRLLQRVQVGDRLRYGSHFTEDIFGDATVFADFNDNRLVGVEVLNLPSWAKVYVDNTLAWWHWLTIGRAWEQAQQLGVGVVRGDWLVPA